VGVRRDSNTDPRDLRGRSRGAPRPLDDETRLTAGVVDPTQIQLLCGDVGRPESQTEDDSREHQDRPRWLNPEAVEAISCSQHADPPWGAKHTPIPVSPPAASYGSDVNSIIISSYRERRPYCVAFSHHSPLYCNFSARVVKMRSCTYS